MTTKTALDRAAIEARMEAAHAAVIDMCSGRRQWRMTVPVDMERDHDMVIIAALDDIKALLAALDETEMQGYEATEFGAVYELDENGGRLLYHADSPEARAFHEKYGDPEHPADLEPAVPA